MNNQHSPGRRSWLRLTGLAGLLLPLAFGRTAKAASIYKPDIKQLSSARDQDFIERAFEMRDEAVAIGDQAYGALVVRDGRIVGQSASHVVVHHDPTAHAEIEAIRDAAARLGSRDLSECTLYSSSRACPMCEAAAYWANINRMVYGKAASDAGHPGLCG